MPAPSVHAVRMWVWWLGARRDSPRRPVTSKPPVERPACYLPMWPTPISVEAAAEEVERISGPIDVWVNVAFTSVFAPFAKITAGRVQASHRGDLPRLRLLRPWPC